MGDVTDAHAELGDAHAELGDAHAELGDAHAELGDAHAGQGDAHADRVDAHADRVDVYAGVVWMDEYDGFVTPVVDVEMANRSRVMSWLYSAEMVDCVICHERCDDDMVKLVCDCVSGVFCSSCFREYVRQGYRTCPICRMQIDLDGPRSPTCISTRRFDWTYVEEITSTLDLGDQGHVTTVVHDPAIHSTHPVGPTDNRSINVRYRATHSCHYMPIIILDVLSLLLSVLFSLMYNRDTSFYYPFLGLLLNIIYSVIIWSIAWVVSRRAFFAMLLVGDMLSVCSSLVVGFVEDWTMSLLFLVVSRIMLHMIGLIAMSTCR